MTSFYTRRGDEGFTDLLGDRVPKFEERIGTIGVIDEASAQIGMARALTASDKTRKVLTDVQRDLYLMMAELAFSADLNQSRYRMRQEQIDRIEHEIDFLAEEVQLPPHFVLPGDTVIGAVLDVARTIVRRAERCAVKLLHEGHIENKLIVSYLNRLSSLLFILARFEDHEAGITPTKAKMD